MCLCVCFFFLLIDILELFPFILSLDHESFDNLTFRWHELTEFDSFILKDLHEFIDLELGKRRNGINHAFLLKCGK